MIIFGLGNPPEEYGKTRHNAGFWFLDALAQSENLQWKLEKKCSAWVAKGSNYLLVKPSCYMNVSGHVVQKAMGYFKQQGQLMVVAYDEMSFDPGIIRFKLGGSAGGHNGVKSIISHLGQDFYRIRIGIGQPPRQGDVSRFVTSMPSKIDRESIDLAVARLVADRQKIIHQDWAWLMNKWNQSQ